MMNELGNVHQQGMTELTYIATKAMQGLIANTQVQMTHGMIVENAYNIAQAMLNEQKKHE
jgi:phage terminase large subunit-like protein